METQRLDAYHFYEKEWNSYEELRNEFEWEVPDTFNIAEYVCDRWASNRGKVAFFYESENGTQQTQTYWQVQSESNRVANYLEDMGIGRGDRVGVSVEQRPEAAIAHIACWKLGAVTVPLSTQFGPDALKYRLDDCDAVACVVGKGSIDTVREISGEIDTLDRILSVGVDGNGSHHQWGTVDEYSGDFETAETKPTDDALIIYTSGTTGDPKGVQHGHQVLLGHLPRRACVYLDSSPDSSVSWSPVEWSWIGSLVAGVLPTLYYGQPQLAYEADRFDPETAFDLIERYGVSNFGGPTTVLRMMAQVDEPSERYNLSSVRKIGVGGEAVGESIRKSIEEMFENATILEAYGQTEADHVIGDSAALQETRSGKMGCAFPGHEVTIVDQETGEETVDPGEIGEIAVRYEGDPVCFKSYWGKPELTDKKIKNGWLLTEDLGTVDEDGYFTFEGRKDDVIITSGYRVSAKEVEETVVSHEDVAEVGVIGISDEQRGTVPKAVVVPAVTDFDTSTLTEELQNRVKDQLAPYEYPREIEFVSELPKTTTGKVRRSTLRERENS
jgi:acetyl-CoA synthetase